MITPNQSQSIPVSILNNLIELKSKLESNHPDIRENLIVIHRELSKDQAIVTILTDEQRATIFQGYKKQSGVEMVTAAKRKKPSKMDISNFL